jgi:hypothetical protein
MVDEWSEPSSVRPHSTSNPPISFHRDGKVGLIVVLDDLSVFAGEMLTRSERMMIALDVEARTQASFCSLLGGR